MHYPSHKITQSSKLQMLLYTLHKFYMDFEYPIKSSIAPKKNPKINIPTKKKKLKMVVFLSCKPSTEANTGLLFCSFQW